MPKEATYAQPGTLLPVDRPAGQNDVGVVSWLLTLKTPECPQGRQVSVTSSPETQSTVSYRRQSCTVSAWRTTALLRKT